MLNVQIQPGSFQIAGNVLELPLLVLHLGGGVEELGQGVFQLLLLVQQVVVGDDVLDVGKQHQEKQDQRHGGHHVRIRGPEALFAPTVLGEGPGVGFFHCLSLLSGPRVTRRMALDSSRTAKSIRSTVPRRL